MIFLSLPSLSFCLSINLNHSLYFIPLQSLFYTHKGIAAISAVAIDSLWWCFNLPGVWHAVGALCETGEWGSPHSHSLASSGGDGLLSIFILLQPVFSLLVIFKTSQVFSSVIIISLSLSVVQPTALHLSISHLICLFSTLLHPSRCLRFQKHSHLFLIVVYFQPDDEITYIIMDIFSTWGFSWA